MHLFPASVTVPREAGLFTLECVLRTFWDCKLELNFVPVYRVVAFGEGGQRIGNKIEFFVV